MFALEENKISSMIEFAKERDKKLHEALTDVRSYLQENLRFEEKAQVDMKFKEQELFVDFVGFKLTFYSLLNNSRVQQSSRARLLTSPSMNST